MDLPQLNNLLIDTKAFEWIRQNYVSMAGFTSAVKGRNRSARQFLYHAFFSRNRTPRWDASFSVKKQEYKNFMSWPY